MKTLLNPTVIFVTLHLSLSTALPTKNDTELTNEEINKQIQALEKEEQEVYKNITAGIDDSLKALENATEEDTRKGLEYLDVLKDDLKDIVSKSGNMTRRDFEKPDEVETTVADLSPQDQSGEGSTQKVTESDVRNKFEEWLKTKKIKKKDGATKADDRPSALDERCPRSGRDGGGKGKAYPCCRDCCRQSYLGC